MIREWSCDAPRSCPNSNRSSPTTPAPARFAAQYRAPEPIPPRPTTATSNSRSSTISDLGFAVRVVFVGAHRTIGLTLPRALFTGKLVEYFRHGANVRVHRSAARADVVDTGVARFPREVRHFVTRNLQWIQLIGETRQRREVGLLGRRSVGDGLRRDEALNRLAHFDRDRERLLGAGQAVHPDNVRACGTEPPRTFCGRIALVRERYLLLERHRHHHRQIRIHGALDEQERLAEIAECLSDPEVGWAGLGLILELPIEQPSHVIGARSLLRTVGPC